MFEPTFEHIGTRQPKDVVEQVTITGENSIDKIQHGSRRQKLDIPQVSMQQDIKNLLTNFRDVQQVEVSRKLRLRIRSLIGNEERIVELRSD